MYLDLSDNRFDTIDVPELPMFFSIAHNRARNQGLILDEAGFWSTILEYFVFFGPVP